MKSPALSFLTLLSMSLCAPAQSPKTELISPQVKAAVEKAVKWLVAQQRPAGLIVDEKSNNIPKRGDLPSHSAAMTSLALMGLASVGHMPSDPTPEGKAAGKALRYLVEGIEPDENGYLGRSDRSRMYGHGIISLTLAEMIGHAPDDSTDKRMRGMLDGAIKLILRSQQVSKRSQPRWMALRAAKQR